MIQLSILKIIGYGPWTLTLGSDREHELQMLQASLYKDIQGLFSQRNGIVFLNRHDEFFAVSNGLGLDDHIRIQDSIKAFDVRLSVSIGCGNTPFEANLRAHEGIRDSTVLDREHNIFGFVNDTSQNTASIMHLDIDGLTAKNKTDSPYEISSLMLGLHYMMAKYFLTKDSLTFFMGGDNFMVVASDEARQSAEEFIQITREELGVSLNCGIGTASTARAAIRLATKSLDTIREIRDSGKQKPDVYELSC